MLPWRNPPAARPPRHRGRERGSALISCGLTNESAANPMRNSCTTRVVLVVVVVDDDGDGYFSYPELRHITRNFTVNYFLC